MVHPLLSHQKSLEDKLISTSEIKLKDKIDKCIRTCIDYIHNIYKMPFNEYKTLFVASYYLPKEITMKDIEYAIDTSDYISKKNGYKFSLMFNELPITNKKHILQERCRLMIPDINKKNWYYTLTFILNSECDKVICSNLLTDYINVIKEPTILYPNIFSRTSRI